MKIIYNEDKKHEFKVGEVYRRSDDKEEYLVVKLTLNLQERLEAKFLMFNLTTLMIDGSQAEHWKEQYECGILKLVGYIQQ